MARFSYALFAVALAACGGRLAATDDGGASDAGTSDAHPFTDGAPPPFDGGPHPPPDASPPPPDAGPPPIGAGYVLVEEIQPNVAYVAAEFSTSLNEACVLGQPSGTCAIATCNFGANGLSAGTIDVGGGSEAVSLVPMQSGMGFQYPQWQRNNSVWPPGSMLGIKAQGAMVPPFAVPLVMPTPVQLQAPQPNGTIDSNADLLVAWSMTSAPEVLFYLIDNSSPNAQTFLSCFFPTQPGRATVPSTYLRQIRATSSSGSMALVLVPTQRQRATAAPFLVEVATLGNGSFGQINLR